MFIHLLLHTNTHTSSSSSSTKNNFTLFVSSSAFWRCCVQELTLATEGFLKSPFAATGSVFVLSTLSVTSAVATAASRGIAFQNDQHSISIGHVEESLEADGINAERSGSFAIFLRQMKRSGSKN